MWIIFPQNISVHLSEVLVLLLIEFDLLLACIGRLTYVAARIYYCARCVICDCYPAVSDAVVALCGCAFLSSHQEEVNPLIPRDTCRLPYLKKKKIDIIIHHNRLFEKIRLKTPSQRVESLINWVISDIFECLGASGVRLDSNRSLPHPSSAALQSHSDLLIALFSSGFGLGFLRRCALPRLSCPTRLRFWCGSGGSSSMASAPRTAAEQNPLMSPDPQPLFRDLSLFLFFKRLFGSISVCACICGFVSKICLYIVEHSSNNIWHYALIYIINNYYSLFQSSVSFLVVSTTVTNFLPKK